MTNGIKLTKRAVDAAAKGSVRYEIWDKELAGFGLRIETSGKKTFLVRHRVGGGRRAVRRKVTVGRYGVVTPDAARAEAKKLLGKAANGRDPADVRGANRREMTIAQLIVQYEREGCVIQRGTLKGSKMKPMTKRQTLARLNNHIVPLIGRKKISDVRSKDIEQIDRDVTAGKTARDVKGGKHARIIVRGGPGMARKVIRDLSAVFTFAQRHELAAGNPVTIAAVNKVDNKRKRFLTLEEVQRLGAALKTLEAKGANRKAIDIARLWVVTGFRRNEAAGLKKAEIDFDRGGVRLIDSKEGESVRPIGASALMMLRSLPAYGDSPYFFPAERGEGFYVGTGRIWQQAITLAELPGVTPHTLRHTMGSHSVSLGDSLKLTAAILGHASTASTEVYAHMQHDPSKVAADRVSGTLSDALEGKSKVVQLRSRKRETA
jgi:integrase